MTQTTSLQTQLLDPPPRFSLRSLLILQAACAVFFAIAARWGIYSVPIAVAATLFLACTNVRPDQRPMKRFMQDLLGGIFLPVLCAFYDPLLFSNHQDNLLQVPVYAAIVFQMTALLAWLFGRWRLARLGGLFAGIFLAGAILALGCGIVLLPFSFIGLLVIIGLAGFAPFITCHVFLRHFLEAKKLAYSQGHAVPSTLAVLAGFFLAFAVPILIYLAWGEDVLKIIRHIPWPAEHARLFGPD